MPKDITLREHLRRIGKSRSPRKLAALAENRKKAAKARMVSNPSPATLAKRASRERKADRKSFVSKWEKIIKGV